MFGDFRQNQLTALHPCLASPLSDSCIIRNSHKKGNASLAKCSSCRKQFSVGSLANLGSIQGVIHIVIPLEVSCPAREAVHMHMRHRLPCCLTILPRQVDFETLLSMRSIPMAHQQLDKSPTGLIYLDVCMQRGIAAHAQVLIAPCALDKNGMQTRHLLSHVRL